MRDAPRRRRSDEESGGRGLPLFPLIVVVVLAGLLLGGVLAHFFGGKNAPSAPASTLVAGDAPKEPTPAPISPPPSAAATPSATPVPSAAPSPTASIAPSPKTTPATTPRPSPAGTPKAKAALATPAPTRKPAASATQVAANVTSPATARPATAPPATAPPAPAHTAPPSGNTHAASVVRSYLEALARGDRGTASTYLAHGYPTESFMNSESRIESISSANVGGQQYRVGADVQTSSGEYFITFTLQQSAGGMLITDHSAIKPQ